MGRKGEKRVKVKAHTRKMPKKNKKSSGKKSSKRKARTPSIY